MALRAALGIPADAYWVLFWLPVSAVAIIAIGKMYGKFGTRRSGK